jgi:choline dehydrogenase-like flavoprotein
VVLRSLSDQRDLISLRNGVRRMVEIVQRPSIVAISEEVILPNGTLEQLDGDKAIDEWLPSIVGDYVHVVGTCRMGPPDDHRAVVDLECAVYGYQALSSCRCVRHARSAQMQHTPHHGRPRREIYPTPTILIAS